MPLKTLDQSTFWEEIRRANWEKKHVKTTIKFLFSPRDLLSKKCGEKSLRRGAFLTAHGRDGSWQRRKERLTADAMIDREVVLKEVAIVVSFF